MTGKELPGKTLYICYQGIHHLLCVDGGFGGFIASNLAMFLPMSWKLIEVSLLVFNFKDYFQTWQSTPALSQRRKQSSSTIEITPACVSHCKLVSLLATSQGHEQRTRKTSPGFAVRPIRQKWVLAKQHLGQRAPRPNSYFKLSVHPGYLGWEPVSSKL